MLVAAALVWAAASEAADGRSKGRGSARAGVAHGHHHPHRHHHGPRRAFIGSAVVFAPVWYYPAYVWVEAPQPVYYLERADEVLAGGGEWLFCASAGAFFPTVIECAGGWERLPAQPVR